MVKTGKGSFIKPQMKKAQSTLLGSKEFLFNNTSRGQNMSQMSKDVREETGSGPSGDPESTGKMIRRNTILPKSSA